MPNQAGIDFHSQHAEALAEEYAKIPKREVYKELYEFLDREAEAGHFLKILDIGCGTGLDAIEIAKIGHKVIGIEPSKLREIAEREHWHENIEYRDGTLPKLETVRDDEKFDMVIMSTVWQYIDPNERVESLIRIAQTLKPNGRLRLSYPYPPSRDDQYAVPPDTLKDYIAAANAELPHNQRLSIIGEPLVREPSKTRDDLAKCGDLKFYTFTIETGHAQAISLRDGWADSLQH